MLYWPPCWVAYKRKSWRAWTSVCSQRSTPPHPSWTQPELHHLDTVCWISKFPTNATLQCPDQQGRAFQSIRQLWARPDQQGRALSNLSGNFGHTLFNLSSNLGCALSYQSTMSQERGVEGGIDHPGLVKDTCTTVVLVSCLSSSKIPVLLGSHCLKEIQACRKLNEDSHTSVALVFCMSSWKPMYWMGCVVVDRSPQTQVPGAGPFLKKEYPAPSLPRFPFIKNHISRICLCKVFSKRIICP